MGFRTFGFALPTLRKGDSVLQIFIYCPEVMYCLYQNKETSA